jgi:signal transduction histidine kinase
MRVPLVVREWSLATFGALLLGATTLYLLTRTPVSAADAALVALPIAVAVALLVFSTRVQRGWTDPAGSWHVARWALGGAVVGLFGDTWYGVLTTLEAIDPPTLAFALNWVAVGAAFGAGVGYYDARQRRRAQQLRRRSAQLDEFAGIVSHDLRNPLNIARGHLEIARERHEDEDAADAPFEAVERAHARMERLIDEVLSLSRHGRTLNEVSRVDVGTVAGRAWGTVETEDATLSIEAGVSFPADAERLRTLFENLFRNSVEHGAATVRVGPLAAEEGFYVADDGPGIPAEHREQVFEGGFSTRSDGTGFGLAIVRRIAEAHGWAVSVAEGREGGARFEFRVATDRPKG